MSVSAQRINVTTTRVALNTAGTSGMRLTVKNGAGVLDLGGDAVPTGGGLSVDAGATVQIDLQPGDVLYGISDATGTDVEVLRT